MSWAQIDRAWDDLLKAIGAFWTLLLELRGAFAGELVLVTALVALAVSFGVPLWVEAQRHRATANLRPLLSILGAMFGLSVAWGVALEFGRARYLRSLFEADQLDPSQRAREAAFAVAVMLDTSAVSSFALLTLSLAGLWTLRRGERPGAWTPLLAASVAAGSAYFTAVLVRTGGLLRPFGASVGGEAIDPSEKGRMLFESLQRAQAALEFGRVAALATGSVALLAVAWCSRRTKRPSATEWRVLWGLFGTALLAFVLTRAHRADATQSAPDLAEEGVPCATNPEDLPQLRTSPVREDVAILQIQGDRAFVDGIPIRDVVELEEILVSKSELRRQLFPEQSPHAVRLAIAAKASAPAAEVLRWANALEEPWALAAVVVRPKVRWPSSVLGELTAPATCAAVRVNPTETDENRAWGAVVLEQQAAGFEGK